MRRRRWVKPAQLHDHTFDNPETLTPLTEPEEPASEQSTDHDDKTCDQSLLVFFYLFIGHLSDCEQNFGRCWSLWPVPKPVCPEARLTFVLVGAGGSWHERLFQRHGLYAQQLPTIPEVNQSESRPASSRPLPAPPSGPDEPRSPTGTHWPRPCTCSSRQHLWFVSTLRLNFYLCPAADAADTGCSARFEEAFPARSSSFGEAC